MTFSPDSSPSRITPNKAVESAASTPQSPKNFQSYMQDSGKTPPQAPTSATSPAAPPQVPPTSPPTLDALTAQAKTMQDSLGTVAQKLKTPNLSLKRSQAHLLKNKLSNAQGYIRDVGTKLGAKPSPTTAPTGPMGKFLAYINDGQNQLIQVQQKLDEMSQSGHQINPAEMLSVTVKMNLAQQEIEYSSTLLGKVIDSIKQIFNVQL